MPISDAAAHDAIDLEFNRFVAEEAEDGMKGPDPADAARSPAHGFWAGKFAHDLRNGLRYNCGRSAAGLFRPRDIIVALGVFHNLTFREALQASGAQETLDRFLGRTDARPFPFLDG